ncbi:hypothetical protein DC31_16935 [Microbacterium sp. CH12i]|uniref:RDD family protein n=1 Tax=Microbacterium sp. CH12i TaxID=1479651 RepID=UPI000461C9C6|nr:RDD family protein [Microbacterium sp. CH12i]KDA05491.1 hypothetical protein DC31_16935 [Microbacterium sp. CH12i]
MTQRGEASDGMIWEISENTQEIEGLDADGRPDPAYAAALGLLNAPYGRRAAAVVCDVAIWVVLQLPLWLGAVPLLLKLATGSISTYGLINHPGFVLAIVTAAVTTLLSIVFSVVQLVLHGTKGMTIGKAIAGIRSVNVRTLERPKVGAVFLRYLIVGASNMLPLLGPAFFLISPTFDPDHRGRGLHDKATNVWLVDVRGGLNPYDEKRMRVARKVVKAEPMPERSALPSLATPEDPAAQPEYRPGSRVSAGVIGVARPYEPNERPVIGLPQTAPSVEIGPIEAGKPVFGGYRNQGGEPPLGAAFTPPVAPVAPDPAPQPVAAQPEPVQPVQPQPVPPQSVPPARFALRLDTGESILISEPVLLGRNPDAAEHPGARPIAMADDSRSLSKTHLLVQPVDGGLEIVDCRSTNGSGLIRSGAEYTVTPDVAVMVMDGDTILFGDRTAAVVRV